MSRREPCPLDCKVYVGELGNNGTRHELEDAFGYYGPLKEVWVARNPPGFAFVMFQDPRDARDAVRGMDGKMLCGKRIRVELSTGKSRHDKRYGSGGSSGGSHRGGYSGSGGSRGDSRYGGRESPRDSRNGNYHQREPSWGRGGGGGGSGRGGDDRDRYVSSRRRYSRSRSRSVSPIVRGSGGGTRQRASMSPPVVRGGGGGRPRTPPSRSRSRSPIPKSPRSDSRYR